MAWTPQLRRARAFPRTGSPPTATTLSGARTGAATSSCATLFPPRGGGAADMGRIVRAARAAFTGAAVLTAGFFLSGGATRVSALAHELARSPGTEPIEGSRPGAPRIVLLDGSPARMRRCLAPASSSLEGVLDHYERVASRESALPGRKQLPYIVSFDGDSACVIWTNARDLARRGVLVSRTAAGIEYSLLDGDP